MLSKVLHNKFLLLGLCFLMGYGSVSAVSFIKSKRFEAEYQMTDIVLPDGHIKKDFIASTDDGKLFIPYELVEDILDEQLYWDKDNNVLNIGDIPTASVMSDKVKIYHYDYDDVHSFFYSPNAKTNKTMTMANKEYESGYYFTNVYSASFNLSKLYSNVTGILGLEDFKASSGHIDFYLDDEVIASYDIKADALPEKISLNVKGGDQLKIAFSGFAPDTQINFADVYIN